MWRCVLLWQASTLLAVAGTLDFRLFNQLRQTAPNSQVNCFEYVIPNMNERFGRATNNGWRPQMTKTSSKVLPAPTVPTYPTGPALNINEISRRIDFLLPNRDATDIVKEHAKLVQDINSLRQVVFVAPIIDENKDYDDSIFHEMIETSTTTTPRPTTTRPLRSTKASSLPVILVGGASQRQVVRMPPLRYPKPTISLVGTSISPLMKHPYPFVMQEPGRKPIKVCMTAMPMMMYPTTRRPSLWQRILHSLIPR